MKKITITVRSIDQKEPYYKDIHISGLRMQKHLVNGTGTAEEPYLYKIQISNPSTEKWTGVIHFEISEESNQARFFLPAFIYGRNQGEKNRMPNSKLNPRIREGSVSIPYSPFWMTRADRLSHPVSMLHANGRILGISASPHRISHDGKEILWHPSRNGKLTGFNGFTCTLGDLSSVGYTLGYEDAPFKYIDAGNIEERNFTAGQCISVGSGESITFPIYIYDFPSAEAHGIIDVIRNVYQRYHEKPGIGSSFHTGIHDLAEAIYQDTYLGDAKSYATMLSMENNVVNKLPHTSISWTGGAEIAVPLLMTAIRTGNSVMREQALSCIQNIVDHSLNEKSGLPYESYADGQWSIDGWWQSILPHRGHSSYVVGQALYYILKAYDYEKRFSCTLHSDWIRFSEKILKKIAGTKNSEGEYPYIWSEEDGNGIEYDSFAGCWCLTAMTYLAVLMNNHTLLEDCFSVESHYYNKYVRKMECYGTPIDTFKAVDSEGILAYIRAVKMLHEQTGDPVYLEHLKHALEYEFSFKFCYNTPVQVPPLSHTGWSSSGGSVTSTANHHVHPMSSSVMDEILYYINCTGDSYYADRLKDTLAWGLQTYNRFDGQYDFGKKGWMSERFCYSEGLLCERYPDGSPSSTWFFYLPWGSANILEGMCGDIYEVHQKFQ